MDVIWQVVSSNPIMFSVLVVVLVARYLGPRLRRFWKGGF